jgi:hypothetical protein
MIGETVLYTILLLVLIGVLVHMVPMDPTIKRVVIIIVIVLAIVMLLFGPLPIVPSHWR